MPGPLLEDVPFFDFANFLDAQDQEVSRKIWLAYNKGIGRDRMPGRKGVPELAEPTVSVGDRVSGGESNGEKEEEEEKEENTKNYKNDCVISLKSASIPRAHAQWACVQLTNPFSVWLISLHSRDIAGDERVQSAESTACLCTLSK